MKVRCGACRRFFDQRVVTQTDCPRCEREPVQAPPRPVERAGWRRCACGAEFQLERKRGRPPVRCPECRG